MPDRADPTDDAVGLAEALEQAEAFLGLGCRAVLIEAWRATEAESPPTAAAGPTITEIVRHIAGMVAPEIGEKVGKIPLQLIYDARAALGSVREPRPLIVLNNDTLVCEDCYELNAPSETTPDVDPGLWKMGRVIVGECSNCGYRSAREEPNVTEETERRLADWLCEFVRTRYDQRVQPPGKQIKEAQRFWRHHARAALDAAREGER